MEKELDERLGEFKKELDRIGKRTEKLPGMLEILREHHRDLHGHGNAPGMKIMVDRLSEWMKSEKRLRAMLISAIIAASVSAVFACISGLVVLTR